MQAPSPIPTKKKLVLALTQNNKIKLWKLTSYTISCQWWWYENNNQITIGMNFCKRVWKKLARVSTHDTANWSLWTKWRRFNKLVLTTQLMGHSSALTCIRNRQRSVNYPRSISIRMDSMLSRSKRLTRGGKKS